MLSFIERNLTIMVLTKKWLQPLTYLSPLTMSLGTICLVLATTAAAVMAQMTAQEIIDHFFLSDELFSGETTQEQQERSILTASVVDWLGDYQGIRAEADYYVILFENGSVPVTIQFQENGDAASVMVADCPVTTVPVSQAPSRFQADLLTYCPNLIP
jgi:hypothetical protein